MVRFDFIGNSKKFFTVSAVLIVVIIVLSLTLGPRLDIQFKGGSMITYSYDGSMDMETFGSTADSLMSAHVSVRESTDLATQTKTVIVTLPGSQSLSADEMAGFTQSLRDAFPANNLKTLQINNVDPVIGREFLIKSMWAVAFASLVMVLYIWARFRRIGGLSAGVMAVLALVHDVVIVFGVFVIFRIPLNDNFIAVILTILGYSLNDTIVIYDRIRENKRLIGSKIPVAELVNTSIRQSCVRSIITSITTITAMTVVSIVAYIYNVNSILSFSFPMILGLMSGNYSSLCVAGPLWVKWQERRLSKAH